MRDETGMVRACREQDGALCSNENREVCGHRKIGRPKRRCSDIIQEDMTEKRVSKHKTGVPGE